MNWYQILIIVLCCIIIILTTFLTIGYIKYNQDKKKQNKINKFVFHKVLKYHLPKEGTVMKVDNAETGIEYIALCKFCGKPIAMYRKKKNKRYELKKEEEIKTLFKGR